MNAMILNCILLSYFRIRCFCYYVFVYFLCFNFPLFPPLGESIILKLELSTRSSLSILEFHIILSYHAFLKMLTKISFHMTDSVFAVTIGFFSCSIHREPLWVFRVVSNIIVLIHLIKYFQ